MAVPEDIRKVPRPKNTVVVDQGREGPRRYAVRDRKGVRYIKDGNPQPINGQIIGHIINGAFVPIQPRQVRENETLQLSYGAAALVYSVSRDVFDDLLRVYAVDEASQIMALASLRVLKPGLPAQRVQTEYKRTFISRFYPGVALSANTIGKLKQRIGENEGRRLAFYELRMSAVMKDHHIAIDGTLRQDNSTVNDLSSFSRKSAATGDKHVSILYAYDIELAEPICATVFPGNVPDQGAFSSFVRKNGIKRGIVVADKGFPISKIRKELEDCPDLHYLAPIRRNDVRIKKHKMTEFEGTLEGTGERVLYKKVKVVEGKFLYGFRDFSTGRAEEANYLDRSRTGKVSFDYDTYEKKLLKGGTIVFESDLDMEPSEAYKCYADRWMIELVFRSYKNEVCLNKTRVQHDHAVWGDEFINFISTLLTCRILRKLGNAGLLDDSTYAQVMDDLSSAWREVNAPMEPRRDDDGWVHTTNVVHDMLEALKLSAPIETPSVETPASQKIRTKKTPPEFVGPKRRPGRPKGSKNKKTLEREAAQAASSEFMSASPVQEPQPEKPAKRGRGRPKGSKNKKTLEREVAARSGAGAVRSGSEGEK